MMRSIFPMVVSRRGALAVACSSLIGLTTAVVPSGSAAQEVGTQNHPLVGTWFHSFEPQNQTKALDAFTLHADGTCIRVSPGGSTVLRVRQVAGPMSAHLTCVAYVEDERGINNGGGKLRLILELNPDGDPYTAEGSYEFIDPSGSTTSQVFTSTGTGTRMKVELPGAVS